MGASREQTVWIFHGEGAHFASAVFTTEAEALAWAERRRVSGIVTEYPVGDGCYDIAVERGTFTPSKPHHGTPEHVAAFSPGWTRHVHLTDGLPASAELPLGAVDSTLRIGHYALSTQRLARHV